MNKILIQFAVIGVFAGSMQAFAQTTTTLIKSQAQVSYELTEAKFKKEQRIKKIASERRADLTAIQTEFRKKRSVLTESFQADLKKIELSERKAIDEVNKKYDALAKD